MSTWSYLSTLFLLLQLARCDSVPGAPSNASLGEWEGIEQLFRTYYCPFEAQGKLASDFSSIDITYDTSKPATNLLPGRGSACYARVFFTFSDWHNQFSIGEIEYTGVEDAKGTIETKTVFSEHYGPMYWTPVSLSESRVATNASKAQLSEAGTCDLAIRTVFPADLSASAKGGGILTQRLKLSWLGKFSGDYTPYSCEWPDNAGNADTLRLKCRYGTSEAGKRIEEESRE